MKPAGEGVAEADKQEAREAVERLTRERDEWRQEAESLRDKLNVERAPWIAEVTAQMKPALERAERERDEARAARDAAYKSHSRLSRERDVAREQARAIAEALREIAESGVSFDDERLGYVEVQIDRDTLDRARAALALYDQQDARA